MTVNYEYDMMNIHDGGLVMIEKINNNNETKIEIKCGSDVNFTSEFDIVSFLDISSQIISDNKENCIVFVNPDNFISKDARKIFINIIANSYDVIPRLSTNKLEELNNLTYQISLENINTSELINIFKIFILMIDKANIISKLISRECQKEYNSSFFAKYKALIEGIKTTYEKGLILIKMFNNSQEEESLLAKYYQLIQKKEDTNRRLELVYDLLFMNTLEEQVFTKSGYTRKRRYGHE